MPGRVTTGGLATGPDTGALIEQLVRAERRPLDLLARRAATVQAARGAVAGVGTRLAALANALAGFRPAEDVLVRGGESSDPRVEAIVGRARTLVDAFNELVRFVDSIVRNEEAGVAVGSLAADGGVRRLVARLRAAVSAPLAGSTGPFVNLASIGITTARDGTLALDEARLRAALARDPAGVAALFAGNGAAPGVANALAALVAGATVAGGLLDLRTAALDQELRGLEARLAAGERRLDALAAGLRREFAALETLGVHLDAQAVFLQSVFGSR